MKSVNSLIGNLVRKISEKLLDQPCYVTEKVIAKNLPQLLMHNKLRYIFTFVVYPKEAP